MSPPEVEFYFKNEHITDIALEASARLFCSPKEAEEIAAFLKACAG